MAKLYARMSIATGMFWGAVVWAATKSPLWGLVAFAVAALGAWFVLSLCYVAGRQ